MKKTKSTTLVRIDPSVHRRLRAYCAREGLYIASLVSRIVTEYLNGLTDRPVKAKNR